MRGDSAGALFQHQTGDTVINRSQHPITGASNTVLPASLGSCYSSCCCTGHALRLISLQLPLPQGCTIHRLLDEALKVVQSQTSTQSISMHTEGSAHMKHILQIVYSSTGSIDEDTERATSRH